MTTATKTTSPALLFQRAPSDKIREAVIRLFAAYPAHGSEDMAESAIGTYCAMLAEYPLQAITDSARLFLSGRVQGYNPAFRPSVAQWASEARKCHHAMLDRVGDNRQHVPSPPKLSQGELSDRARFVEEMQAKLAANITQRKAVAGENDISAI